MAFGMDDATHWYGRQALNASPLGAAYNDTPMGTAQMIEGLIDHLTEQERWLLRKHGVRLRVDKITSDGRYALCSSCQTKRSLFRPLLSDIALVALAHRAFMRLNIFELQTLISVVPKGPLTPFLAMDPKDPFQLVHALSSAKVANGSVEQPQLDRILAVAS